MIKIRLVLQILLVRTYSQFLISGKMEQSKRCVIVTGFGPFNGYDVNASWEAVRLLPELDVENDLNVKLVTKQIPVAYESVTNIIPSLWSKYKPLVSSF